MTLASIVETARNAGASDVHLEAGFPPTVRVRGQLQASGEPLAADALLAIARELVPGDAWSAFVDRRSADLARTIQGVRCRINVFCTARGVGLSIRLLAPFQTSIEADDDLEGIVSELERKQR